MISITAFGRVPSGTMVRREGLHHGDRVVVTGTIGDAALGLDVLKGGPAAGALDDDARSILVHRYQVPQPRLALARAVREHASAAMDVSDGLAGDLAKLCAASGVSAIIDASTIPLSDAARAVLAAGAAGLEKLIAGGDDYEVLCGIPEDRLVTFSNEARLAGVSVTAIGTVVAGTALPSFLDREGRLIVLSALSYSHF
jgi:thiamine-monophosphate kinase